VPCKLQTIHWRLINLIYHAHIYIVLFLDIDTILLIIYRYWIKVCLILLPIFILVILLSVAFILCTKTKKARKEEFRLIYTLPTTTLGTVPRSPFRPNFTPRPSIVNEVPKYDAINSTILDTYN
jgi:hypothetical protein